MNTLNFPKLYAITDSQFMSSGHFRSKAEAALKGGCQLIQYRDKSSDRAKRQAEAELLKQLCIKYQAQLIINDDIQLAKAITADGVHLGQEDASVAKARQLLGERAIIGVTCHNQLALAHTAIDEGADYIAFGRFFSSRTKPSAREASLSLLQQARREFQLPIVAIGGINRDNASQIIDAGADSIAVSHGLFAAENTEAEASQLLSFFKS